MIQGRCEDCSWHGCAGVNSCGCKCHQPVPQPLASEVAPGESEYSLDDYMNAPSGIGPLAPEWEDKPHRLVYDLVKRLKMAEPQGAEAPWPLNMFCEAHADTTLGDANVSDPCPLCAADEEIASLREQLEQAKLTIIGFDTFRKEFEALSAPAAPRPQEPRCPRCGCGSKKNERKPMLLPTLKNQVICYACETSFPIERLSDFAQFFSPAQSPQKCHVCHLDPPCQHSANGSVATSVISDQVGQNANNSGPAQSQGAAPSQTTTPNPLFSSGFVQPPTEGNPSCHVCGAIFTPTGLTRPGQPKFQCLSCGATTSCTEGAAETSDIANIVNWRKESE